MTKPLVYLTRRLPGQVLSALGPDVDIRMWDDDSPCPRDVLLQACTQATAVLTQATDQINEEFLATAPHLRIIAHFGVGYNNIDVAACTARSIRVTNTPGVLTQTTADMGFALLMAAARRIVEGHTCIARDEWRYAAVPLHMAGQDIYGATLGVIGAGRIGGAVLRRGRGFNMKLLYHNRAPSATLEADTGAAFRSLDELLGQSNFVVMCVPLTPETRGMLSAREFALMRPDGVFVNISRGQTIIEADLVAALKAGRPWAAGLDVFEQEPARSTNPLLSLPNVVCTPHCGSSSIATRTGMGVLCARNIVAMLAKQPALTPVN